MAPDNIKIIGVVGARPNFMKIAPLIEESKKHKNIKFVLVHTGQHYDDTMSQIFLKDLKLPKPRYWLGAGSDTPTHQMDKIMVEFEKVLLKEKPDLVIVVGDVNSTLACALTSAKLQIPLAHVEAGLRSFDKTMPEEINRILTDHLSDYLFVTEKAGVKNLRKEGIKKDKIHLVGNVLADTLLKNRKKAEKSKILEKLGVKEGEYVVLTLHRPSNVDDKKTLTHILSDVKEIQKNTKIIFPLHPRTRKNLKKFRLQKTLEKMENLTITSPLGYLDFIKLMSKAKFALTDSGGIQEETTILGTPCITLRKTTEHPVTTTHGTNKLVGKNLIKTTNHITKIKLKKIRLWDGKTSQRIIKKIIQK